MTSPGRHAEPWLEAGGAEEDRMPLDRKLRFGVIGMTSDHVWSMVDGLVALPEVEVVAAADPHAELRERAASQWALTRCYDDYDTMLEREELDAVVVCTDNASKAEVAEAAARRRVHIYQDKPMAATLAQADRIMKAAETAGITLMVAYHTAFSPTYEQTKALLAQGTIGPIYLARGVTGHGGPVEVGCSKFFCEWLFDKDLNGGGTFIDEGCYLLSGFVDCVGPVVEVSAFTTQMGSRSYLPPNVEDNSVAILRFANGALGVVDAKWGQVGPAPVRTSYHGTHGTLTSGNSATELYSTVVSDGPAGWEPIEVQPGFFRTAANVRGWRTPMVRGGFGRGGYEQRCFVDHLLSGQPIEGAASPKSARHVQEVIDAVYRSAELGRAVRLPLD
jgi:predicted dehydrogenase